ncbi:AAA family ATPase [Sporosarcina pasteurii]|uniref:Hemin importer ATP-binding subunit n=1 Tax=Sporosarcina pasteurii TaxID=1474 RepID=A0A380BMV1_SPOPA|nr:AAA family ATPase [Sporosarcina pasteurii]MDS9470865.1 AAA family ATPase [Sporosarcina pasteurii]QBQ05469.1 hypothetical protein E2C16_07230 [Sporosarcina pasteurii]SUJ02942.1 hemin importer ATP-binding subunit [Sporosarcina pasteurii]
MITNDIIEWVKKQPYWQKVIAKKILSNDRITDQRLDEIFQIFKRENKLCTGEFEKEELNFSVNKTASNIPNIRWKGLASVHGVNAIRNGENLPIGDKVTLVYGKNGSGKSSYTRLLNNIFISRGDKNIMPNLYSDTTEMPKTKIVFENESGDIEELKYPDDKGHAYNKRITVFDSYSAIHDLTKETELSFSPTEFKFFDDFLLYIEKINSKFEEEISTKNLRNDFIKSFDKETSIKQAVSNLGSRSDIDQFKEIIKVSKEDITTNEQNTVRKAELQSMNIDVKKGEYNQLISNLEKCKDTIIMLNHKFSSLRLSNTKLLIEKRNEYKLISSEEGLSQFKNDNIYNLGSPEWKQFIRAAQNYYQTVERKIDYCIFCKQNIDGIMLVEKYWKYLKSDAETNLITKESEIEKIKKDFSSIECTIFTKESKLDEWLKEYQPKLYENLVDGETGFKNLRQKLVQSLESCEWDDCINTYEFNLEKIDSAIKYISTKILELNSESIQDEIEKLQAVENEYFDKLKAEKLLSDIEKFVLDSKWLELAKNCKIMTRPITLIQNQLFSKYVTGEYVKVFNEECKKLKAEFSAEIKQRGSKGATLNKLTVKGKRPSDILSEGEQRSIAIANFLAETSIHNNNICIIFDDPVSSLDYKRREVIANRLIEEAHQKQVVILTHDLTFLLALQNKCEEQGIEHLTTTIRKIQTTTGIVEDSIPWIGMPVRSRIAHLKNKLQKLTSNYNKITPDQPGSIKEYEEGAKFWCEQLRETWERCIEEILFNDSVQRFSPAIHTQRLKKAPFTTELYTEIEKGMAESSNWVHDRASGLGEETPEPEVLKKYLDDCEAFIKKNRPK